MSKEFHVFTLHETTHEQAVVFEVNRDIDNSVELGDVYLVSTSTMGELKTKLNMQNIIGHIIENKGGNVPITHVEQIIDVFDDLITDEHKIEIRDEISEIASNIENINPESLIIASEMISGMDPNSLPDYIEKLKKGL